MKYKGPLLFPNPPTQSTLQSHNIITKVVFTLTLLLTKEYGPPPGKESLDERRVRLAQVKQDYEKSLTEYDAKRMEQVSQQPPSDVLSY